MSTNLFGAQVHGLSLSLPCNALNFWSFMNTKFYWLGFFQANLAYQFHQFTKSTYRIMQQFISNTNIAKLVPVSFIIIYIIY